MYIGAKILHNLSNNTEWSDSATWIRRFHRVAFNSASLDLDSSAADARLLSCQHLSVFALLTSRTVLGYSLFKQCSSLFLKLVDWYPDLCSRNSSISLHGALWSAPYEICRFAFYDTIMSLAFALPPLIHYDTTPRSTPVAPTHFRILESVYGAPADILVALGRVNAWRVSQLMGQAGSNSKEWKEVRDQIENWHPLVTYIDESSKVVGRLAVQEAWRQSALIYVYMGMCLVNSADPRVEVAVRQVVQLASTIEPGSTLERHIFMPALIAGVAARQEKHRAMLRSKIYSARGQNVWLLPGPDFVAVLDHLWHGVGAGGAPTTWEDYVDSRCTMLPLDIVGSGI
ncbi:hypothetical protein FS749_004306 [Ceratobasidium sp. UAMH 11750]|nr:hypothetical protein FS749_004306 [Ceratobasidium sp. UAMH 11750]